MSLWLPQRQAIRARDLCRSGTECFGLAWCAEEGDDPEVSHLLSKCGSHSHSRSARRWRCLQEKFEVQALAQGYSDTVVLMPQPTTVAEFHADQTERVVFNPKQDVEPRGQRRKMTPKQEKKTQNKLKRFIHNVHKQGVNTEYPDG